jgi:hypothetical protein
VPHFSDVYNMATTQNYGIDGAGAGYGAEDDDS